MSSGETKADIKNEIVGIASTLPYASSEQDAKDGIKEIIKLLEKLWTPMTTMTTGTILFHARSV